MKVLVMGNNDHMGGIIVHYITLSKYLKEAGHKLFCININDTGGRLFTDINNEVVVPYKPKSLFKKALKLRRLLSAVKAARAFKPDVFIATGLGYGYAMVACSLPRSTFKFFGIADIESVFIPVKLRMLKYFDAVSAQTPGMATKFKEDVSNVKPVAYLPCFSKEYNVKGYKQIPPVESIVRLAYFGRLAVNKGLKEFINATCEIFKKEDVILDIYGKGTETYSIQNEITCRRLQSKIRLKGFFEDSAFPDLIGSYHGIIIPSINTEGLPLVMIEAMRFGRPILCTTIGAMPEIGRINKSAIILSEKEPLDLCKNFLVFIQAIRQRKYSAESIRNLYEDCFSNDVFAGIWHQMMKNPRAYFMST